MEKSTLKYAEALNILFMAIQEEDARKPLRPNRSETPGLYRLSDYPDEGESYLQSPLAMGLRAGLRDFGRVLAKTMTTDEMLAILDSAIEAMPQTERWEDPTPLVDHCWDGLVDVNGKVWVR